MSESQPLRGLLIGAGYFSDFHLDAWNRIDETEIVAVCDLDRAKAKAAADKYGIAAVLDDPRRAISLSGIDFVDIVTPPASHLDLVTKTLTIGLPTICQKPLAPDAETARQILELAGRSETPFMVHENFRFQPWYRKIRQLIDEGHIGDRIHALSMRTRMGDGWGEDAYLARQPYFREMPRMLIHETGVHIVDSFRYLAGEISGVQATLQRLNPVIRGEDAALVTFAFESGASGLWDANRYNESLADDPRYTFGQFCIEGNEGSLWFDERGTITCKRLAEPAYTIDYHPATNGFAGDCVHAAQRHFVDVMRGRSNCETSAAEYAKTLEVVEQIYQSARRPVSMEPFVETQLSVSSRSKATRRIIDLSLPIDARLPAAAVEPSKSIEQDGWRATTLRLYSHCGTHLDAPCHFLEDGQSLEQLNLQACIGTARVIHLQPVAPRELLTVDRFERALDRELAVGERLLLRTDWHHRYPDPEYRERLPRISRELARYLVEKRVRLIGVEPPSVADVNNLEEVTEVHHILLRGGVVIVEGLTNLDQLDQSQCHLIAVPLNISGGDGCPVRALAVLDGGEPDSREGFGFRHSM